MSRRRRRRRRSRRVAGGGVAGGGGERGGRGAAVGCGERCRFLSVSVRGGVSECGRIRRPTNQLSEVPSASQARPTSQLLGVCGTDWGPLPTW